MKRILIFLFILAAQTAFAQGSNNVSTFHRLLIYNSDNEVMIVSFKDTDIWVTPGFYQDSTQFIKEGLHQVASTYGITITDPELKGVFSMRKEFPKNIEMGLRNIYRCNYIAGEVIVPEFLGEVKWVPISEALETITFESIKLFLKQTHDHPNYVWGGSVNVLMGDPREYTIVEEFYPLYKPRKKRKRK